jgi:hypothetical protein
MRCNNGAATPLHFPVAVMPREIRSATEPGQDKAIWGNSCAGHQPRRAALIAATSIFFMPIMASNARFA